jgi:hypothetical protein
MGSRVPWRVWADRWSGPPLLVTNQAEAAVLYARDMSEAGHRVWLEEPRDGIELQWRAGRFVTRFKEDDVPVWLRSWAVEPED